MSSSTAIEFGLISTLRTNNVLVDAVLCMLVPLLIQRLMAAMQNSPQSLWALLLGLFFRLRDPSYVHRVIEHKERFNRYGCIWNDEQQGKILQKAVSLYLTDMIDLRNKTARCELLEKPKRAKKVDGDADAGADLDGRLSDSCSTDGTDSEASSIANTSNTQPLTEVDMLNIESLPPFGHWIEVEKGVEFMHENAEPANGAEKDGGKGVKETTTTFHFRSNLPDGSRRIDSLIKRAFEKYQTMERAKYKHDKARYFYIQSGTSSQSSGEVVAYKRYALGEQKTFENLFFDEKEQVLQLLDNFTNKTGKFAIRGFPYKLGFLLHGPPGTGKTSLIKAIAQHTKRHIVTINLSKIKTNQELLDAVFDLKFAVQGNDLPVTLTFKDVVFVMEDIDCASRVVNTRKDDECKKEKKEDDRIERMMESQKKAEMSDDGDTDGDISTTMIGPALKPKEDDKLNLSGLLNVLDGVIDCPGRIVVMTTNHPEKLDPALIRPGRVNKNLHLTHMNAMQARKMIEYYSLAKLSPAHVQVIEDAFARAEKPITPAEIEEFCAEFDDVGEIVAALLQHAVLPAAAF